MKKFLLPVILIFLLIFFSAGFCASGDWRPIEKSYGNKTSGALRVLVAYASRAGSTAEVADAVGKKLADGGTMVDVKPVEKVQSLDGYSAVVLGSAVRRGEPLSEMTGFIRKHKDELKKIPVAYFIVCLMVKENTPENQAIANSYLDGLRREVSPVDTAVFAGKMDYSRINFIEKLVIKYIKSMPECDVRDWPKINEWAAGLLPKLTNTK